MTTARAQRAAELAAAAVARAAAHAESYDSAPPRRPMNGHSGDCPNRYDGRMRRCSLCRAELLARDARVINGVVVPEASVLTGNGQRRLENRRDSTPGNMPSPSTVDAGQRVDLELRACLRCFYPTTDPEGHCP